MGGISFFSNFNRTLHYADNAQKVVDKLTSQKNSDPKLIREVIDQVYRQGSDDPNSTPIKDLLTIFTTHPLIVGKTITAELVRRGINLHTPAILLKLSANLPRELGIKANIVDKYSQLENYSEIKKESRGIGEIEFMYAFADASNDFLAFEARTGGDFAKPALSILFGRLCDTETSEQAAVALDKLLSEAFLGNRNLCASLIDVAKDELSNIDDRYTYEQRGIVEYPLAQVISAHLPEDVLPSRETQKLATHSYNTFGIYTKKENKIEEYTDITIKNIIKNDLKDNDISREMIEPKPILQSDIESENNNFFTDRLSDQELELELQLMQEDERKQNKDKIQQQHFVNNNIGKNYDILQDYNINNNYIKINENNKNIKLKNDEITKFNPIPIKTSDVDSAYSALIEFQCDETQAYHIGTVVDSRGNTAMLTLVRDMAFSAGRVSLGIIEITDDVDKETHICRVNKEFLQFATNIKQRLDEDGIILYENTVEAISRNKLNPTSSQDVYECLKQDIIEDSVYCSNVSEVVETIEFHFQRN